MLNQLDPNGLYKDQQLPDQKYQITDLHSFISEMTSLKVVSDDGSVMLALPDLSTASNRIDYALVIGLSPAGYRVGYPCMMAISKMLASSWLTN